jgi:hypothetical protein
VFPTGHSAAPSFTILALGRRLGHHLVERRRQMPAWRFELPDAQEGRN